MINPVGDLRKFTAREIGETERVFYVEHRFIEECLELAIIKVRKAVEELLPNMALSHDPNVPAAIHALAGVENDLAPVIVSTVKLGQMPEKHFEVFRKYFNAHPLRNLKGPSGAFTARMPLLELLFRGDELPTGYTKYIEGNWQYFPRQGRSEITEALRSLQIGNTLASLWRRRGKPKELLERITVIGEFFNRFRQVHYQAVARQIPAAITGDLAGTGGEANPGAFLRERIKTTHFTKGEK